MDKLEVPVENTLEKISLEEFLNTLKHQKYLEFNLPLKEITTLNLSNCQLKELPECFSLTLLKELNLSHNNLKQVPECFFGSLLPALENLDLSYNFFSEFDREPDFAFQLRVLNLNKNTFTNIPKWLLEHCCVNLEHLNYSENKAIHYNFKSDNFNQSFLKLKKLELKSSCLIDEDLKWLKKFPSLEFLDISNVSFINSACINKFKDLEALFDDPKWCAIKILKINNLSIPFFPQHLVNIVSLCLLHIRNNNLSWLPEELRYLVNLEVLDVSDNHLVFISNGILQLSKLKVLLASGNCLEEIPLFPSSLEVVDLYNNFITTIENLNINNVQMCDLDYNCVDLETLDLSDLKMYLEKKRKFRELYNISHRFDHSKPKIQGDGASLSNNSEESYWEADILEVDCQVESEEDWDKDYVENNAFPSQISSSDNEFDGNECDSGHFFNFRSYTVHLSDEDWMFVDAD